MNPNVAVGTEVEPESLRGLRASSRDAPAEPAWHRFLVGLPAGVALGLGSIASFAFGTRRLDPDVIGYEAIARQLNWDAIFGGSREPMWPLVFYLPVHLLGDHAWIAIRGIGVAGFVFMVIAFQALVSNLFGRTWSIMAALVVAASPFMVLQATRGLREQTSAGLLLLLCIGLVQPKLTHRRWILLFGLTAVTGLLRADVMDVMLGALFVALLVKRPPAVVWVAGPVLVLVVIGPQFVVNYVQYGDPFYHTDVLAKFFRNLEFVGQPGFITSDQLKASAFGGTPVTWTQYIFGMHTPGELLRRAVLAYMMVPTILTGYVLFFGWHAILPTPVILARNVLEPMMILIIWCVGIVGAVMLLWTRAWVVTVIVAGQILMYSTIAPYMDYRLVLDLFPLLAVCVICGLLGIAKGIRGTTTNTRLEG